MRELRLLNALSQIRLNSLACSNRGRNSFLSLPDHARWRILEDGKDVVQTHHPKTHSQR